MTARSAFTSGCILAILTIAGWALAQNANEPLGGASNEEKTGRYEVTLVGRDNESAILLNALTGESWYLRKGNQGTVWLKIPRISSPKELEQGVN